MAIVSKRGDGASERWGRECPGRRGIYPAVLTCHGEYGGGMGGSGIP